MTMRMHISPLSRVSDNMFTSKILQDDDRAVKKLLQVILLVIQRWRFTVKNPVSLIFTNYS
jgi:hypothetical protein